MSHTQALSKQPQVGHDYYCQATVAHATQPGKLHLYCPFSLHHNNLYMVAPPSLEPRNNLGSTLTQSTASSAPAMSDTPLPPPRSSVSKPRDDAFDNFESKLNAYKKSRTLPNAAQQKQLQVSHENHQESLGAAMGYRETGTSCLWERYTYCINKNITLGWRQQTHTANSHATQEEDHIDLNVINEADIDVSAFLKDRASFPIMPPIDSI
ncbi:hypothetical protein DFS34DRAFT_597357 [Phlyctochytrium arcticum]|nr:hypothetical protein DFS34DRAFT_597357 [Phlyctochytrium arcticum]